MNEDALFKTKDFYLTAYLRARNHKFVEVKKNPNKKEFYFCFLITQNLNEEIASFYEGNGLIEANKFINSIRDLKALIINLKTQ